MHALCDNSLKSKVIMHINTRLLTEYTLITNELYVMLFTVEKDFAQTAWPVASIAHLVCCSFSCWG